MALDVSTTTPRDLLSIALGTGDYSERDRSIAIEALRKRLSEEEEQIAFGMRLRKCSWSEIGTAMGMSKQAAQQRFGQSAGLLDKLDSALGRDVKP